MKNVAIGGSGKSHLARELGRILGAPVTHLDAVYFDDEWNPLPPDRFAGVQRELVARPRWVIVLLTELRRVFSQVSDGFGFSSLRLS